MEKSVVLIKKKSLEICKAEIRGSWRHLLTVEQALATKAPSIGALMRSAAPEQVGALIKLQLIELNELLGLKRPLTELAIDTIAEEILQSHRNLSMADVALIFRRARTGQYGQFYESINMPKVMEWFNDYFNERCEVAANMSLREGDKYNGGNYQRSSENKQQVREQMRAAQAIYLVNKQKKKQ